MTPDEAAGRTPSRRWGSDSALLDDEEARRRLLDATVRCIVRRGNAAIRMAEVADEAGVARSTVYRYFPTRAALLLELVRSRTDRALARVVAALPRPDDAADAIPALILELVGLVDGNELNEALFAPGSGGPMGASMELGSDELLDVFEHHVGPLFERWQADGQVHVDLDVRETLEWTNAVAVHLLRPPWRSRPLAAKRAFLDRYLVRALVPAGARARP